MQAMVEAVPITPQVPAVVARRPSISSMRSSVTLPGAIGSPVAAAIGAGGQALALERRRQHRAGDQLHRRDIGRGSAHQLRRHRLVAAADQHRRIHRLGRQHRLGVDARRGCGNASRSGTATARTATPWGTASAGRRRRGRRASPPRSVRGRCGGSCCRPIRYRRCPPPGGPAWPGNSPWIWRKIGAGTARNHGRRSWRYCGRGRALGSLGAFPVS